MESWAWSQTELGSNRVSTLFFFSFLTHVPQCVYIISSICSESELPNILSNTEQAWEMVAMTHHYETAL